MNRITAAIAFAGMLAAPLAATATTVADCKALIEPLQTATLSAKIEGRNAEKDRIGLVTKLDGASSTLSATKLSANKIEGAAQKVSDYQSKLMQLLNGGKIDQPTFDLLNYGNDAQPGADDVQACIADIQL